MSCSAPARLFLLALTISTAGCSLESFHLSGHAEDTGADPGAFDAGSGDDDGDAATTQDGGETHTDGGDAGGESCAPVDERCDGVDNDCDGNTDEGIDLSSDPGNCGGCGLACRRRGAAGTCEAASCAFDCLPTFYDLNGDLGDPNGNGCEYGPCTPTGDEVCNKIDDDCDGSVDEDVAGLNANPEHCGSCFHACTAVNVEARTCSGGTCGYTACLDDTGPTGAPDGVADYADIADPPFGCEYRCPVNPPLDQELCNGFDDDCDGVIDELPIAGLGTECFPDGLAGCEVGIGCDGVCGFGVLECNFGVPTCVGWRGPEPVEQCDDIDRDCDGNPRNGFTTDTDPNHCGAGCAVCEVPFAIAGCAAGECVVQACRPGHVDLNDDANDGCEYECTVTGAEVCDGADNDCNGLVDDDLAPPPGLVCSGIGACDSPEPSCSDCGGVFQWRCVYGASGVEVDSCGRRAAQEALCDGVDGDCDGAVDEAYPQIGTPCDDGGVGICKGEGSFACSTSDPRTVVCDIPADSAGAEPLDHELCNNLDDDCNGLIDDLGSLVDDTVAVSGGFLSDSETFVADFRIDMFEASRPDATATTTGSATHLACSNPGVMPWRSVTRAEAEAACEAAGKRLCSDAEWQRACEGAAYNAYPYGSTYDPQACNGNDYDADCQGADNDICLPAGSDYGCPEPTSNTCVSEFGAFDMSGNLEEWTGTEAPPGSGAYRVRGGSYFSIAGGLTCQLAFASFDDSIAWPNLGFRCCSAPN